MHPIHDARPYANAVDKDLAGLLRRGQRIILSHHAANGLHQIEAAPRLDLRNYVALALAERGAVGAKARRINRPHGARIRRNLDVAPHRGLGQVVRHDRVIICQRKLAKHADAERVALLPVAHAHLVNELVADKRAVNARPAARPPAIRHARLALVKRARGSRGVAQQHRGGAVA